ncbi:MAG TPA: DUF4344 domain-containing metallopeptidase [Devosia sp.]
MKLLPALLMAAAIFVAPAAGQELTEEQQQQATEFAINNSIFVIQHEIGHLLIGEFGLPVLGKEEDAADSLATLQLLGAGTDEADQALIDSADGWYLSELDAGEEYETSDFYDEHSLSIQRAYQVVCLAVGANPEAFADTATEYEIDADRQESCGFDYQTAATSWASLLEPHEKKEKAGGKISVVYEDGGDYGDIAQLLKDVEFLEGAAAGVAENYALPRDLTFTAKLCGEENAYYSYDEGGITFCYELVGLFFRLIEEDMLATET